MTRLEIATQVVCALITEDATRWATRLTVEEVDGDGRSIEVLVDVAYAFADELRRQDNAEQNTEAA